MKRRKPLRRGRPLDRSPMRESETAGARRRRHVDRMAELRPVVLARANYRCERCGRHEHERGTILEAHHRLMRSQGGPDTLANLVALCGPNPDGCHGYVHAHPAESYETGLLIRRSSGPPSTAWNQPDPLDTPLPRAVDLW